MAIYKTYDINLDTKRLTKQSPQGIRAGETGVKFNITVTNGGSQITFGSGVRVVLEINSNIGKRVQDSASDSRIAYVTSGNVSKCSILLDSLSFAEGMNRCVFHVFTTASGTNDTEICAAEFQFVAEPAEVERENVWYRGSTPTHTFGTDIDLTTATTIEVTYEQNGKVVVTKQKSAMTVTSTSVSWTLTSADTLAMSVGNVGIQMKYVKNGVTDYSEVVTGKVMYSQGV